MIFWNKLSLAKKLFAAIVLTSAIIVLAMTIMVNFSMRAGFARYVLHAELNSFNSLERSLALAHTSAQSGWPEFLGDPIAWQEFVTKNHRGGIAPPHHEQPNLSDFFRAPPPHKKPPLGLNNRISLLDADGKIIAGERIEGQYFITRAIFAPDSIGSSKPLGWIGLSAPLGAAGPADRLFISNQTKSLILASILALAISALVAWFLARHFLTPIMAIVDGVDDLAGGNYETRLPETRRDELGKLEENFNMLAASLESAARTERQWITDTSHEMQTPLAILRAEIEAMQDGVRQPTRGNIAGLHASVMRLSHLVNDINTLSRTREGSFSLNFKSCSLNDIIAPCADYAQLGVQNAGLTLEISTLPDVHLWCDSTRLTQLLDNLLENSKRYTNAPGIIRVSAKIDGSSVQIIVEDSSPCPSPEQLRRLTERFYRVETSRSRALGGSGLGLSICEAIAQAHSGTLKTVESELGGLKIVLTLPIKTS